ncbi:MAG: hypothetical protein IJC36_04010 [Clostridia bacterium]|nr:hypothetical protein [Clostridia bacterium]
MNTLYKEGDIYKVIAVFGKIFEIKYGYYSENERTSRFSEVIPIYPDFKNSPEYTGDGHPFVTQMQDICPYYDGEQTGEDCFGCKHYHHGDDLIGICKCTNNKLE